MDGTAAIGALAVDEAGLARAAGEGDGRAFAALYRRYEGRVFNFAYRISGSEEIAAEAVQRAFRSVMRSESRLAQPEHGLGTYLLMASRSAAYDLMQRGGDVGPAAVANGNASAPGELDEVRRASMRLPARQREALALRELGQLPYGEIAVIMETQHDAVAQLISRGRINLSDELHGTVLASVAAPSAECERALPLIAMHDDGQLDAMSGDAVWLDEHLAGCERCGLGVEAMGEAAASYRAWVPMAVAPWLLKATMARASELAGADWSEEIDAAGRIPAVTAPNGTPN